jgi:hypothetical protein
MKKVPVHIFLFLTLFFGQFLNAQNITGTWEGYMTGEFIQINIEQKGNELCGYTYDYVLEDKSSHCIAPFEGRYDPERKLWFISGKKFIENNGGHVLMRIILWRDEMDAKNILKGKVYLQSSISSLFGMGADDMKVKKVSSQPQELGTLMPPCFPKPIKPAIKKPVTVIPKKDTVKKTVSKPVAPKVAAAKPVVPNTAKPVPKLPAKKDTIKKITTQLPSPIITQPDKEIIRKMISRKQTEQNRLEVSVKKINLKVYDNGVVDNDTVSIFYNGKLLLSHQRLSEAAIELNIDLDENISLHEITMYAENLGGIPPNTALIVITAGDKRYELRSKASLEENAVLIIEYKPR